MNSVQIAINSGYHAWAQSSRVWVWVMLITCPHAVNHKWVCPTRDVDMPSRSIDATPKHSCRYRPSGLFAGIRKTKSWLERCSSILCHCPCSYRHGRADYCRSQWAVPCPPCSVNYLCCLPSRDWRTTGPLVELAEVPVPCLHRLVVARGSSPGNLGAPGVRRTLGSRGVG